MTPTARPQGDGAGRDRTVPWFPDATVLGYPRIGPNRELKKAVEAFWAGRSELDDLLAALEALRRETRGRLARLGLPPGDGSIPGDFSAYDHVLDAATTLGAVPARFADLVGEDGMLDLPGYFALARGDGQRAPLELTKWFDSNYHYLVPEIGPDTPLRYGDDRLLFKFLEAAADGVTTRPVMVGPVTFLLLSKPAAGAPAGFHPLDRLDDAVAAYADLLRALGVAGAPWLQLDEPALVSDAWDVPRDRVLAATERAYAALADGLGRPERPALFVSAGYGPLGDALPVLARSAVEAVGLDLVRGALPPAAELATLAPKVVVAGVVDGRNVWRTDLDAALGLLERLRAGIGEGARVAVATSTSLLHVPHDAAREKHLSRELRGWLAFADQKVEEVLILADALARGREAVAEPFAEAAEARRARLAHPGVRTGVRERLAALDDTAFTRAPYPERRAAQQARLGLPTLPTTTIGSFPQTPEIRRARAAVRRGTLSEAEYRQAMRAEIERVVRLQERLGLDVLVHGEPERNDMVQYFAELLDGFAATEHGWVQSYGSRCTRPAILWGDVARRGPMTVEWTGHAASLTDRPVKGMLTGPVTILAWSFVRDDQPLGETALQVALALRDEIADLEAAGIGIVQVDEPALRELLPLRTAERADYLDWSVRAFRLATSGAPAHTQVHTHLCYSEFGAILGAIDRLDADVTSVEAARSRMEVLADIRRAGFGRQIGPGVYDIHSPRVPSVDELTELLEAAVAAVPPRQLWVNPDCGLKTRRYEEVTAALEHLVAAAHAVRATLPAPEHGEMSTLS
ncbi:5-methyltetrahydropteroyltriglutamate--homocysteine S-methyltransferase [Georgenia thermotolerans]|uniref:5-methyltetrahydropteroyltriglutamate--homocysteine methyltransferase n=1 Tax=Georgenia thermotolerans TaxID=527326 RepID=A0A7J5URS0_9MICO|nr:5-methyltetrahydropteroyltriglutamate--homocysteine S-methyltransferase [Georgenia thermotolerans]KAE8764930.1 5-methyltetrahydropteroyltriglutamate--homocysteine S-methyltransferase [Georgenia thermotolerans]